MDQPIKNITLSFCCQENWNKMTSIDERTKFCATCKHSVIDFTKSTNEEFEEVRNSGQRVCGRFTKSQMSPSFLRYAAATALISAVTMSCSPTAEMIQPIQPPIEEEILMGDVDIVGIVMIPEDSVHHKPDSIR
jgi:hypothetical protein